VVVEADGDSVGDFGGVFVGDVDGVVVVERGSVAVGCDVQPFGVDSSISLSVAEVTGASGSVGSVQVVSISVIDAIRPAVAATLACCARLAPVSLAIDMSLSPSTAPPAMTRRPEWRGA
jgi:hypothetical protein